MFEHRLMDMIELGIKQYVPAQQFKVRFWLVSLSLILIMSLSNLFMSLSLILIMSLSELFMTLSLILIIYCLSFLKTSTLSVFDSFRSCLVF
jgi:hypothetical protein